MTLSHFFDIIMLVILMFGAIIGDLSGSIYEYDQIKKVTQKYIDGQIITKDSFFSDDTILTIAILDAVLNNKNYEYYLKKYTTEYINYKPNFTPYFKTSFSPMFIKWVNDNKIGTSIGNGAMMRISPIGYLFDNEKDIITNAKLATMPSHNTEEAINCATVIALIIFYLRKGLSKEEIIKRLNIKIKYEEFIKFNYTCKDTIDNCLYALFTSNNFEDSIKKVISYGGDTDTNACIVGSMAEALFGIDENLISEASKKIPFDFVQILDKGYSKIKKY